MLGVHGGPSIYLVRRLANRETMGLVLCEKHGPHSGPLCCRRVLEAISGTTSLDPSSAIRLKVDMLDDGSELAEYVVCPACGSKYGLGKAEVLPSRYFDADATPWVAPACSLCFEEWYEQRSQ